MALDAYMAWECRAEGSATNGSGFIDLVPGTSVDYSQQDAAQLSLTDLVSDVAGTGITSATGGFTAAMVGNVIYIAGGTGFTTGWYEIETYVDTNGITIDRSAGASQTGGTGNVGGAYKIDAANCDLYFNSTNKPIYTDVWVKSGTYSALPDINRTFINIEGYKTIRGDTPTGTDRPLLTAVTNTHFQLGDDYGTVSNIRMYNGYVSGNTETAEMGEGCCMYNCDILRGGYLASEVLKITKNSTVIATEISCESGYETVGILCGNVDYTNGSTVFGCYIHDVDEGIKGNSTTNSNGISVSGCVFANISAVGAFGVSTSQGWCVNGNTFYNCATGVKDNYTGSICNNIFHSCGVGIYEDTSIAKFNCFYNNTSDTDTRARALDSTNIFENPLLTDPSNGDFTLASGSPCFEAGIGAAFTSLG